LATVNGQIRKRSGWVFWLGAIVLLAAVAAATAWFLRRPKLVSLVNPSQVSMTETIASSARVGGVQETAVGAQFTGTVAKLFVMEGDRVKPGQPLATLTNDVPQQQKIQAAKAVEVARSQLAQASRAPSKAELAEAEHQVTAARGQAAQAKSDLQQAETDLARATQMAEHGLIPKAEFDAAQTKAASARGVAKSAAATVKFREASLQVLKERPTSEDVQVARDRLAEARQALTVAQQQAREATVTAPFAGVVTKINAEVGQTVGATGVVDLVSDSLEMRVDLDENNLPELAVGQAAIISSSAFSSKTFNGRVSQIGAAVNQERGTIQVRITSDNPPDWLRPGQTVNVNLITNEQIERLMVPASAVVRSGGRTVVLVAQDGYALEKTILTRPANKEGVPIAAGLAMSDRVIINPSGISPGDAVRARGGKRN
jgi:HlyD family secretion protein